MLRRFLNIILSPFFQALVVAVIIIFFIPFGLKKYHAEQVSMTTDFDEMQYYFADLDHDGYSEKIQTFNNLAGNVAIALRKGEETLDQWNFPGVYQKGSLRIMIGDYNSDESDEIYLFTINKDSILLSALAYHAKPYLLFQNRFISRFGKVIKDPDCMIFPGKVEDMTGDRFGDIVFAISSGHSLQPRNAFIYDIMRDTLLESPFSGACVSRLVMSDLDRDGYDEMILNTYAPSNYNKEPCKYTDTSSWFMALDHTLHFLFEPIEFKGVFGGVMAVPIELKDGRRMIFGSATQGYPHIDKRTFFISDIHGRMILEKSMEIQDPRSSMGILTSPKGRDPHVVLGVLEKDGFYEIDENLEIRKISDIQYSRRAPYFVDVDADLKEEIILLSPDNKKHTIYRNDLTHPVSIDFPVQSIDPVFSVKLNGQDPPQLSVSGDTEWKLFNYGINPVYRWRFGIYGGIYLIILGFILIIRKLYSIQLKKRYDTEKKIVALQLSSIKAQMEPHFVFNVINSIGSSIYREKKDEAYNLVVRFSNMVRSMLSTSDQLYRTLQEELDFVTNFLELEKQRFPELYQYTVEVEEGMDRELLVPKMILQLHAENAVKHGLRPKGEGGVLQISIQTEEDYLVLSIRDNGIGRAAASKLMSQSTGKGMKILEQLFETYNKHNPKPILQEITDLTDDDGRPAGMLVVIRVPVEFNPEIL